MYKERRTSSKVCQDKWDEHVKKVHAEKLKTVKPSIDNTSPKAQKHLQNRRKRDQIQEDRLATIEKHNLILLDRMMDIMKKPTSLDNRSTSPVKSLNREARKKELQRINEDNQIILRKLTGAKAYYDRKDWDEFEDKQESYLKNICEYPVQKNMEPKLPKIHSNSSRSYSSPERSPKPTKKGSAHRFTPTPTNNNTFIEKTYFSDDDSLSLSDLDSDSGEDILETKEKPKAKANGKAKKAAPPQTADSDSESLGSDFSDSFENDSDKEEDKPVEPKAGSSSKPTSAKSKPDSARDGGAKLDSARSGKQDSARSGKLDSARSGKLDSASSGDLGSFSTSRSSSGKGNSRPTSGKDSSRTKEDQKESTTKDEEDKYADEFEDE